MGGRGQGGRQGEKGRGRQAGKEGPERSRVTSKLDNKTQTDAILLDFAKAFDKVPHKRLLSKLTSHGITGNTHTIGSHLFYKIVSSESRLMEPCRTPHMLHLVSHRAQFWDLYYYCRTSTISTKTFNRVYPPICR